MVTSLLGSLGTMNVGRRDVDKRADPRDGHHSKRVYNQSSYNNQDQYPHGSRGISSAASSYYSYGDRAGLSSREHRDHDSKEHHMSSSRRDRDHQGYRQDENGGHSTRGGESRRGGGDHAGHASGSSRSGYNDRHKERGRGGNSESGGGGANGSGRYHSNNTSSSNQHDHDSSAKNHSSRDRGGRYPGRGRRGPSPSGNGMSRPQLRERVRDNHRDRYRGSRDLASGSSGPSAKANSGTTSGARLVSRNSSGRDGGGRGDSYSNNNSGINILHQNGSSGGGSNNHGGSNSEPPDIRERVGSSMSRGTVADRERDVDGRNGAARRSRSRGGNHANGKITSRTSRRRNGVESSAPVGSTTSAGGGGITLKPRSAVLREKQQEEQANNNTGRAHDSGVILRRRDDIQIEPRHGSRAPTPSGGGAQQGRLELRSRREVIEKRGGSEDDAMVTSQQNAQTHEFKTSHDYVQPDETPSGSPMDVDHRSSHRSAGNQQSPASRVAASENSEVSERERSSSSEQERSEESRREQPKSSSEENEDPDEDEDSRSSITSRSPEDSEEEDVGDEESDEDEEDEESEDESESTPVTKKRNKGTSGNNTTKSAQTASSRTGAVQAASSTANNNVIFSSSSSVAQNKTTGPTAGSSSSSSSVGGYKQQPLIKPVSGGVQVEPSNNHSLAAKLATAGEQTASFAPNKAAPASTTSFPTGNMTLVSTTSTGKTGTRKAVDPSVDAGAQAAAFDEKIAADPRNLLEVSEIPEAQLNEEALNPHFSKFGKILSIEMGSPDEQRAMIIYEDTMSVGKACRYEGLHVGLGVLVRDPRGKFQAVQKNAELDIESKRLLEKYTGMLQKVLGMQAKLGDREPQKREILNQKIIKLKEQMSMLTEMKNKKQERAEGGGWSAEVPGGAVPEGGADQHGGWWGGHYGNGKSGADHLGGGPSWDSWAVGGQEETSEDPQQAYIDDQEPQITTGGAVDMEAEGAPMPDSPERMRTESAAADYIEELPSFVP